MPGIYQPSGAAREYSPLALNYIKGCDHGCVYCLHPYTPILMADQTEKEIKDLIIGDEIIGINNIRPWETFNNGGKIIYRGNNLITTKVINKIMTQKEAFEIKFESGKSVICSKDHRWLTDQGWTYTYNLKMNIPIFSVKESLNKDIERIISIESLGKIIEMIDITTGTENFIANGLISHNCYVPKMMKRFNKDYVHSDVYVKDEQKVLKEVTASARKFRHSEKQVFISFLTDPYSHFNNETKLTRRVLQVLLDHEIPVSILSKGGYNVLQDLDIIKQFGANIQVGGSLTFINLEDSKKWEKNGAIPAHRFDALRQLHDEGIRTWASMEPVIYPEQSLEIMEITHEYIDGYKIGKLNHFPQHEKKFDWTKFLSDAVAIMRKYNKAFYIKKDLLEWKAPDLELSAAETDMDALALKNTFQCPILF